jgi:hypothetical protein
MFYSHSKWQGNIGLTIELHFFCVTKTIFMKTKLLTLLLLNIIFSINSFAQSFQSESSVITYASGKVFSNTDKTVKIEITYDGIKVNGNLAYFNLEISVLSTNVALIKGYSLSNPDGTISFRINNTTGCIVQGSDSYCATSSSNSNTSDSENNNNYSSYTNEDINNFKSMLPSTFSNLNGESITLNPNGTGLLKTSSGTQNGINWSLKVTNVGTEDIKITVKKVADGKIIINESNLGVITDNKAAIYQWIDNKRTEWKNY